MNTIYLARKGYCLQLLNGTVIYYMPPACGWQRPPTTMGTNVWQSSHLGQFDEVLFLKINLQTHYIPGN